MSRMHPADYAVLGIHFAVSLIIGAVSAWKSKKDSTRGYFLADHSGHWFLIGFSIFMTNIGSIAVIGLPGAAAATGIPVVVYEIFGSLGILIMGFFFVPIFYRAKVFTAPEFFRKRFGGQRLQVFLSIQTIILQILMKIPAEIYAGALTIEVILKWNRYLSIGIMLGAVTLATLVGGLSTVMVTDTFQGFIMLIGGVVLAGICYARYPTLAGMKAQYFLAKSPEVLGLNTTCGSPDPLAFHIVRPITDPNYPWIGTIGCGFLIGTSYFSVNQDLLQRCFSAKNLFHARMGSVLGSFLKLTTIFVFLIPGFIGRIEYPDVVGCVNSSICLEMCHNPGGCSNLAYPLLIKYLSPIVVRGFVLAAILASIMSTLTSVFNSGSTLIVIDIWTKIRPNATEKEQLIVGRIIVFVYAGLALLFIPVLDTSEGGQLFHYTQSIQAYFFPPNLIVFGITVLWRRCTEAGAFWGLLIGLALGIGRMTANFIIGAPPCGLPDHRPGIIKNFHYLNYGVFLFFITGLITIVISFVTKVDPNFEGNKLTWHFKFPRRLPCMKKHTTEDVALEMKDNAQNSSTADEVGETDGAEFMESTRRQRYITFGLAYFAASLGAIIFVFFW